MTDIMKAIILGIIEGLTEFLPVSSTGHLILAGDLLSFEGEAAITFKIVIQLGAVMAVLILYWKRYLEIGSNMIRMDFSKSKGLNIIHMILAINKPSESVCSNAWRYGRDSRDQVRRFQAAFCSVLAKKPPQILHFLFPFLSCLVQACWICMIVVIC